MELKFSAEKMNKEVQLQTGKNGSDLQLKLLQQLELSPIKSEQETTQQEIVIALENGEHLKKIEEQLEALPSIQKILLLIQENRTGLEKLFDYAKGVDGQGLWPGKDALITTALSASLLDILYSVIQIWNNRSVTKKYNLGLNNTWGDRPIGMLHYTFDTFIPTFLSTIAQIIGPYLIPVITYILSYYVMDYFFTATGFDAKIKEALKDLVRIDTDFVKISKEALSPLLELATDNSWGSYFLNHTKSAASNASNLFIDGGGIIQDVFNKGATGSVNFIASQGGIKVATRAIGAATTSVLAAAGALLFAGISADIASDALFKPNVKRTMRIARGWKRGLHDKILPEIEKTLCEIYPSHTAGTCHIDDMDIDTKKLSKIILARHIIQVFSEEEITAKTTKMLSETIGTRAEKLIKLSIQLPKKAIKKVLHKKSPQIPEGKDEQ